MANTIPAFDAKNRLGGLLDRVQAGEEITITRHGTPVAMLVPVPSNSTAKAEKAFETLRQIRETLAKQGVKVTKEEIRGWIDEGRA